MGSTNASMPKTDVSSRGKVLKIGLLATGCNRSQALTTVLLGPPGLARGEVRYSGYKHLGLRTRVDFSVLSPSAIILHNAY